MQFLKINLLYQKQTMKHCWFSVDCALKVYFIIR